MARFTPEYLKPVGAQVGERQSAANDQIRI
jgi:hypothetical protein